MHALRGTLTMLAALTAAGVGQAATVAKPQAAQAPPATAPKPAVMIAAGDQLAALPEKLLLKGPAARQRMLVQIRRGEDFVGQISEGIVWTSSDPKVANVKDGVAVPAGNGSAKLTAKFGDRSVEVDVTVAEFDHPASVSFRNEVQSVLAKAGCNSVRVTAPPPARTASNFRSAATTPTPIISRSPARLAGEELFPATRPAVCSCSSRPGRCRIKEAFVSRSNRATTTSCSAGSRPARRGRSRTIRDSIILRYCPTACC